VWLSSKLICPFLRGVKQIERETDTDSEIETEDPTGNSRLCKFNRKGRPGFPVRQLNNRIALKEKPKPKPKNQPKESQSKSRKTCFPQPNSGYCWVIMVFFFAWLFKAKPSQRLIIDTQKERGKMGKMREMNG